MEYTPRLPVGMYAGLKIVVVRPNRIWVKRSWRDRLFNTTFGWRPFAKYELVDGPAIVPSDKCYQNGSTLYCGEQFYQELKKTI